jgi:hypothetical protein
MNDRFDRSGVLLEIGDPQRHGHAGSRTIGVDEQRKATGPDPLEKERGTPGLHDPVSDGGNLEIGIDGTPDSHELPAALERRDEVCHAVVGHRDSFRNGPTPTSFKYF